jgi:hypothetical protein
LTVFDRVFIGFMEEQSFGRPYSSIILPTFFPVSPSIPEENRTLLLKPYIYTDTERVSS